jgi:hypothetical protein
MIARRWRMNSETPTAARMINPLTSLPQWLSRLSVDGVLTTPTTELLQLQSILGVGLVLGGDIVATLALGASHRQRWSLV